MQVWTAGRAKPARPLGGIASDASDKNRPPHDARKRRYAGHMKTVIIGCGRVGSTVAKRLASEGGEGTAGRGKERALSRPGRGRAGGLGGRARGGTGGRPGAGSRGSGARGGAHGGA